jgi:hypothetical protein
MSSAPDVLWVERAVKKGKVNPLQAFGAQSFWKVKASTFRDIGT